MGLDKRQLLSQLRAHYVERLAMARRAAADAHEAAMTVATESEKKEDARAAVEFGSMARGQAQRSQGTEHEIEQIDRLLRRELPRFAGDAPVGLYAVVDVMISDPEEGGEPEGKTLFVLPLGAGTELLGPGGDGFLSVVTPSSPVGRALMGKRVGEVSDVQLKGGSREVEILEVA